MPKTNRRGLLRFDPEKHARFKSAADYGFTFPEPTYPIDRTGGLQGTGMDGNGPDDTVTLESADPSIDLKQGSGDCGPCGVPAHANMLSAAMRGLPLGPNTMTSDQVLILYYTYQAELAGIEWDPTQPVPDGLDNGVDLGDWLLWLLEHDLIEAFLVLTTAEVDAALALFGVVVGGWILTDQTDQDFENGTIATVGEGNMPDPNDGHCFAPGTRVLTDDLRWVPIEELDIGEGLVGFDEERTSTRRRYRRAVVESKREMELACYEVEFGDGSVVVCSDDHRWLARSVNSGSVEWTRTDQLRDGPGPRGAKPSVVARPFATWETDNSRGAGYLAGAFDGEGWISRSAPETAEKHGLGFAIGLSQRDNPLLETVRMELKERGFDFKDHVVHRPQPTNFTRSEDIHSIRLSGGRRETTRFLGSIRPHRLLGRFSADRLGTVQYQPWERIVRVTPVGTRRVVALQTSTRTFVAEGFLAHNCMDLAYVESPGGVSRTCTWGGWLQISGTYRARCGQQFFAVLTKEDAEAVGFPFAALVADLRSLGGQVQAPPPSPSPEPAAV
jgi:hypothetical protein